MGWRNSFVGGLILTIILLSMAASFTAYLVETDQNCPTASGSSTTTAAGVNSTSGGASGLAPVPSVADDLVLSPLATLSLPQGNAASLSFLTSATYWYEVDASQLQTYEQLIPQTVLGFVNSSQEWRAWALQYLPDPPSWLATGVVPAAQAQTAEVAPSAAENSSAVEQSVRAFAANAAGVSLAALDFVSFNGLTAYRTLVATNDPLLAACETLPGQLAQLYESSFESSLPQSERADYLGRALAITSVMLLVGGKDGFADQFGSAIDDLGLGDSWSTVKPYLGDIATKVSAGASSATLAILQTLAERFPQDSTFVTGFTADRIDSMVDVLEKKGVSNDVVQNDIGQIAQAAGTSSNDEAAGDEADALSLQQGGGIEVTVEADGTIVRYDDGSGDKVTLDGLLLQILIPGFDPRGPEFVVIHIEESGVTIYRYYDAKNIPVGGPYGAAQTNWYPILPDGIAKPGTTITVSFKLLDTESFLKSVPSIAFENARKAPWVSQFSEVQGFSMSDGQVQISIEQQPLEGVSNFLLTGTPGQLEFSNGNTYLEFNIANAVNKPRTFKITFDGYGKPLLSIQSGSNFNPVTLVSSDGVRLRIASDTGGTSAAVSTIYLRSPSELWQLGEEGQVGFQIPGASQTFQIEQVSPVRNVEAQMIKMGGKYTIGRLGAEIALTVVQQKFGVENLQLNEISEGGADLASEDGTVTVQARMLTNPTTLAPSEIQTTLSTEMAKLISKIQKGDFANNPKAQVGYAVLSYLNPSTGIVSTIVAVVRRS